MASKTFILFMSNLPRALQPWKSFKDIIRDSIQGQPGWTTTEGSCGISHIQTWADTCAAFATLTQPKKYYRTLTTHIFELNANENLSLVHCNCTRRMDEKIDAIHLQFQTIVEEIMSTAPKALTFDDDDDVTRRLSVQTNDLQMSEAFAGLSFDHSPLSPTNPKYENYAVSVADSLYTEYHYAPDTYSRTQYPVSGFEDSASLAGGVAVNPEGIAVNISHGARAGVRRAIHVSGMPRKTNKKKLAEKLKDIGIKNFDIVSFKDFSISTSTPPRALVLLASRDMADTAARAMNGFEWGNHTLSARVAKDIIYDGLPVVVNGTANSRFSS